MDLRSFKKAYTDSVVNKLVGDGEQVILKAIYSRTYEHQTMNLHDSYGLAVYVDGKIRLDSIRTLDPKALKLKKWYGTYLSGRDEIIDYLKGLHVSSKGISLVVAAAMPYASILEEGKGLKRKYKVLSGASNELEDIAKKYNGTLSRIR